MYDLIRVGGKYHLAERGTVEEGKFVCSVMTDEVLEELGWGEDG